MSSAGERSPLLPPSLAPVALSAGLSPPGSPRDSPSASFDGLAPGPVPEPVPRRPRDLYDFLLLFISLGSVALVFAGPKLFPRAYIGFMLGFFSLFVALSATHVFKWYRTAFAVMRAVTKGADPEHAAEAIPGAYTHVFVVPNYNEPPELLRKTVARLASHRLAPTRYILLLAMEAAERGHLAKARRLADEFRGFFREVVVTAHPRGVPGEQRGKASNVNWAVRACARHLRTRHGHHSLKQYVITVADADAHIPELYVHHLELQMAQADDPYGIVYAPPMFFSRNCADVPGAARVTDVVWSCMVAQNLSNWRGLRFPCAVYSLSMQLADRVNYWDTSPDGIAEDFHTMLRCFVRTDGRARGRMVPVPVNLTNVQAVAGGGVRGYLANLRARFQQAVRHMHGGVDVGYAFREVLPPGGVLGLAWRVLTRRERVVDAADRLLVLFHVLEAHVLGNCTGWLMMLWLPVWEAYGGVGKLIGDDDATWRGLVVATQALSAAAAVPTFLNLFLYERYHRVVDRRLFGRERSTRTLRHLFDYAWAPLSAVLFMTLPATVASVQRAWRSGGEAAYVVGEKVVAEADDADAGWRGSVDLAAGDAGAGALGGGAPPAGPASPAADPRDPAAVPALAAPAEPGANAPGSPSAPAVREGALIDIMSDTPPALAGPGAVVAAKDPPSRTSISGLIGHFLQPATVAAGRLPHLIRKAEVDAGWEGVAWMQPHKVEEKSA